MSLVTDDATRTLLKDDKFVSNLAKPESERSDR